jgi:sugar lactone lactonase YvrE
LLVSEPYHANGLVFDAAGALYVADTFGRRLVRYEPRPDGWLAPGETFAEWEEGWPDGLELDEAGRFMVCLIGEHGAPAHLLVLDTDGHPVDRLAYPGASDEVTNIARRADGLLAVTDSTTGTVLLGR